MSCITILHQSVKVKVASHIRSGLSYFKPEVLQVRIRGIKKMANQFPETSKSSDMTTAIVLFRNDLRVHDNEALYLANKNYSHVIPLYCFDPRHFQGTYHFGFPKTGCHRAKFLLESITELRNNLESRESNLVVRLGKPEDVIPDLVQALNLGPKTVIVLQKEVTEEEIKIEENIKTKTGLVLQLIWGHTLYHKDDLPFQIRSLPDVYTQFRKRVEGVAPIRNCFNIPDKLKPLPSGTELGTIPSFTDLGLRAPDRDSRSAFPFSGGETSGLSRLHDYLWGSDHVSSYKETRNGMIGAEYSTKFSTWLANGCLSPRKIYWEIKKYEKERTSNQSTYWVIFELIWRDYFRYVGWKFGNKLFHPSGIKGGNIHWKTNKLHFDAWKEGRTGVPYIDANMRELAATGFMSNRGRQNVASFLTKDLELDWRLGAEWFESLLIDHDVCSNYGNWLYSAGIGNDPRENRKFNVIKQGLDYDAEGDYVRLWVPELSGVKSGKVHCVWTLSNAALESAEVSLGQSYPHPIHIAPEWSRHTGRPTSSNSYARGGQRKQGQRGQQHSAGQRRGMDFYFSSKNPR